MKKQTLKLKVKEKEMKELGNFQTADEQQILFYSCKVDFQ